MSIPEFKPEDVIGREAKHITYVADQFGKAHDAHFVKEVVHLKGGKNFSRLVPWYDYKRSWYVTQKGRRNHTEKKDYELLDNLQKYSSTQVSMARDIAKILGDYSQGPNPQLRKLARSPYLYGSDVSSTCCLKNDYQTRYPGLISRNTVAGGDIETNVYESDKDGEIICMSVTHKENVYLAYLKKWVSDIADPIGDTYREMENLPELKALMHGRNLSIEVEVVNTPADIVIQCFKRLHKWKPDFFAFWNISFDMGRILNTLKEYGIDPKDVFSDESVPKNFRFFHYKEDKAMMVTASGVSKSRGPQDQWHWITAPATFQCIDSMSTYRVTRLAKGKEPSYALDYILRKELSVDEESVLKKDGDLQKFLDKCEKKINQTPGSYPHWYINDEPAHCLDGAKIGDKVQLIVDFGKLNFEAVANLNGIEWHREMQTKHKIKYGLYNIIDSMRLEQLDEKIDDLGRSITLFSKSSDYKNFSSNPKRLVDDMHFWYLKRGQVIGSSSDQMVHELDQYVVSHKDWIVTLPSFMAGQHGLRCVKDLPNYHTLIFAHVADLDIVSTYPNVSQILNIARETTVMEFCGIKGVSELYRREAGVNLTAGRVNSIEITQKVMEAPRMDSLLKAFMVHIGQAEPTVDAASALYEKPAEKKSVPVEAV
uniref:Nucleic acid binding protein n=1 Tax=Pseudomonas phage RVTF4 TaxID=3236931 RepID=A0AB39CCL2_9VIRU